MFKLKIKNKSLILLSLAGFFLLAIVFIPLPSRVHVDYSKVVLFENGDLARAYLSQDSKWRFPMVNDNLEPWIKKSIMCLEDKRFLKHPGIDILSVLRAVRQNVYAGRIVSGASTLTMQTARLLEPKERRFSSKIIEAFRALQLSLKLSKSDVLKLYLSYAPFGGNIEGLETASYKYFQKSSKWLLPDELAFLMMMPQNPQRWERLTDADLKAIRNEKLKRFFDCGSISGTDFNQAILRPLPERNQEISSYAEHWSDFLKKKYSEKNVIHSTLNKLIQKSIEQAIEKKRKNLNEQNVRNIGAIVIENSSGKIVSAIGNFKYFENSDEQKISSFNQYRSTGSLLKPLFYAYLLSQGEILPETLLEDVPMDFEGYNPKNYDGQFSGLTEAQWSLAHSLNLPWIKLLSQQKVDSFLVFLKNAQVPLNIKDSDIGLSMIVGGIQDTLLDLTRLYTAIANNGKLIDLNDIKNDSKNKIHLVDWFHPGAAVLTSRALALRGRPDYAIDPKIFRDDLGIRWKTGTSQGRKDAWSIGFNKMYTVGVWLGNLTNEAAPALVGSELAAPIVFDIFSLIRGRTMSGSWFEDSSVIEKVEVCSFSGYAPGPDCPHRKMVDSPRGVIQKHRCQFHHQLMVDKKTNLRIHQGCISKKIIPEMKTFLVLPNDVQMWLSESNRQLILQPSFHPECQMLATEKGRLEIIEPKEEIYLLTSLAMNNEILIPLKLKHPSISEQPSCFLNGEPLKFSHTEIQPLLHLKEGDYQLLCSDRLGRSDQVQFSVER